MNTTELSDHFASGTLARIVSYDLVLGALGYAMGVTEFSGC